VQWKPCFLWTYMWGKTSDFSAHTNLVGEDVPCSLYESNIQPSIVLVSTAALFSLRHNR
jgi:hypothetical protein